MADVPGKKDNGAAKPAAAALGRSTKAVKPAAVSARKPGSRPKAAPAAKAPVAAASAAKAPKPAATDYPVATPAASPAFNVENEPKAAAPVAAPAAASAEVLQSPENTGVSAPEAKETVMASQPSSDFTATVNSAVGDIQNRAKSAFDKSAQVAAEMGELTKGNVEAVVESGRIFAGGVQELGKDYAEEAKSAYEQLTADLKEMAAVKSPAELFQLQGKIMRRNFDTLVASSSKNAEAVAKLASDSFAPISGRVNLAAEKLSKVV